MLRCIRLLGIAFAALMAGVETAAAQPTCTTSVPIAKATGMGNVSVPGTDVDGDGLLDVAEDELAACAMPLYHFDSGEPARRSYEPVMLHAVYPDGFTGDGRLRVHIQYAELYAFDGGYVFCNFPEPNGCNNHVGDSQGQSLSLIVTSAFAAQIEHPGSDGHGHVASFSGTHLEIFPSWGKHHRYFGTLICPEHDLDSCDCSACGLGHWDRANGAGAQVLPTSQNVGQSRSFDFCSYPSTHQGFVNDLGPLGYPGEFVFDPCDDVCSNGGDECADDDPGWTSFFDDDSSINSVHGVVIRGWNTSPIFLRESPGGACGFGTASGDDFDGDGVPDACDACALFDDPNYSFPAPDPDGDGVGSACDICPFEADELQLDFDGDGVGNVCDNCAWDFNPGQENLDGDEFGDVCDPDDDNDGCLDGVDEDPDTPLERDGTFFAINCPVQSGETYTYAGVDVDRDGALSCQDPDNDGDGIPDDRDPCPFIGDPEVVLCVEAWTCPLELWWDVCLLGGCDELFGLLTDRVNPNPADAILLFDRIEIANDVLYVTPPAGIDVRGVAEALAGAGLAGLAANGPETGTLRIELWRKGTTDVTGAEIPPRFVALVSEYDPSLVGTGELEVGSWVAIEPLVEEGSLQVASTWVAGASAATEMPDRDGDRVPDPFDGCLDVADPAQVDSNADGFNNRCDADYDEDGRIGIGDFNRLRGGFGTTCSVRGYAADLDMNDDCAIGLGEFNLLRGGFGGAPGPSGKACTPGACAR